MLHIISPPPTPNGSLHVGHLSGPYLQADIFRRLLELNGESINFVVSTDDHQSYVDVSSDNLSLDRQVLVERSRNEIAQVLEQYSIDLNLFGAIDIDYSIYIKRIFAQLFDKKVFDLKEVPVLYDLVENRYAFEAFVKGYCYHCYAACSGGVCESCAYPNKCYDLLNYDKKRYEIIHEQRLVFNLENYKAEIFSHLSKLNLRPALSHFVDKILKNQLPEYILTYKSDVGISADFSGLDDQKINVWAEMFAGHLYFLNKSSSINYKEDQYYQFLGFDNSFFYVILHLGLHFACKENNIDSLISSSYFTNQFYNLDHLKFSTSKNHLIWAKSLADDYNSDVIRLYLSKNSPEYQELNFIEKKFLADAEQLIVAINNLVILYNDTFKLNDYNSIQFSQDWDDRTCILNLITFDYKDFSCSRIISNILNFLGYIFEKNAIEANFNEIRLIPIYLKFLLSAFIPKFSSTILPGRLKNRHDLLDFDLDDLSFIPLSHLVSYNLKK